MKWMNTLGLATQAKKIISGEDMIITEIRNGNVYLLIVASDIGDSSFKKLNDKCNYYDVELIKIKNVNSIQLGNSIGKEFRVALGITDKGFAKLIKKNMHYNAR